MKERLLVLAKAAPEISKKYESLVCVAGITETGEWRRIYPIPWSLFWKTSGKNFKKKSWVEYELEDDKPSDHRPESRKIRFDTVKPLREAKFKEIDSLLKGHVTCIEDLEAKGPRNCSLGVVKPEISDLIPVNNQNYEKLVTRGAQTDLFGESVIKLDIPRYKHRFVFKDDPGGKDHTLLCEDWEMAELFRNCERYRKLGKYKDEAEVHSKVREKWLDDIAKRKPLYFVVGSHFRFPTFMIVGVVYPKKKDILDDKTLEDIKEAREQIKQGKGMSTKELMAKMGI